MLERLRRLRPGDELDRLEVIGQPVALVENLIQTFSPAEQVHPVWTADGKRLLFARTGFEEPLLSESLIIFNGC
jgi:hypothetical protein